MLFCRPLIQIAKFVLKTNAFWMHIANTTVKMQVFVHGMLGTHIARSLLREMTLTWVKTNELFV